mmetsp:Transcript_14631/g.35262  ORF Transcript_14631/g.35262 Transcript_14631/m.35262 type:complete len:537 (+) Transcript_14631:53-1663(+)
MNLINRRRHPSQGASFLVRPVSPIPQLLLLLAFISCMMYMFYMHNMVTNSLVHCASSGNSVGVPESLARPRIVTSESRKLPPTHSSCQVEYERITAKQTPGLTNQDLRRSQAHEGNQYRLAQTMTALSSRERPVVAVVAGGSISLGHGVTPDGVRYGERLETWMNEMFPLENVGMGNDQHSHKVINVAAHGADMCAMAKRLNVFYSDLSVQMKSPLSGAPDLIILEFAVNDYQGQDHLITVDSKTSVFFDGFRELVLCAEVVIHALLSHYPNTAIIFLEMQTAIATRKTGALLHMGVAQHYQIPVVSYSDALFPDFWNLIHTLEEMDRESFTFSKDQWLVTGGLSGNTNSANISSAVFTYPHGCSPCQPEHIITQFRHGGCKSVCTFMERSSIMHDRKLKCNAKEGHIPPDRYKCFIPFFAHDAVHPSAVGHAIAKDFIVHTMASAQRRLCDGERVKKDVLPLTTFVADDFHQLKVRGDYLVVKDVARVFTRWDKLKPIRGEADGFELYADDQLKQRPGTYVYCIFSCSYSFYVTS